MGQFDTMDYNKGYDVSFEGYHKDTGCIDFPKSKWTDWHSYMVNNKPKCFYAYITRKKIIHLLPSFLNENILELISSEIPKFFGSEHIPHNHG